jgi:hypothetical protein
MLYNNIDSDTDTDTDTARERGRGASLADARPIFNCGLRVFKVRAKLHFPPKNVRFFCDC